MSPTAEQAPRAYATMMNTLDRSEYLEHITPNLEAIRKSGATAWAETGWLDREFPGPCVVMAQGDKDNLIAVALAKIEDGKIKRLDLCGAPSPHSARRTGDYPGRTGA